MPTALIIAIGAGIACALILIAGSVNPLSIMFLLLFLPLPLLLVGLGFGYTYAAIAATTGIIGTSLATSPKLAVSLALVAIPSIILAYYALLSRDADQQPSDPSKPPARVWYPARNLLALITIISGVFAIVSIELEGGVQTYGEKLTPVINQMFEPDGPLAQQKFTPEQQATFKKRLVGMIPYLIGAYTTLFFVVNFYVAARITRASGWLTRTWPDLSAITLPPIISFGFIISLGLAIYGPPKLEPYAAGFTGAFFAAYTLVGLAVVHSLTRRLTLRGLTLSIVYTSLFFMSQFIVPLLVVLALADKSFKIRDRFGGLPPPPAGPSST